MEDKKLFKFIKNMENIHDKQALKDLLTIIECYNRSGIKLQKILDVLLEKESHNNATTIINKYRNME